MAFTAYPIFFNGLLDMTTATPKEVRVISKRMSTGKHPTAYLVLQPMWGTTASLNDLEVTKVQYGEIQVGDTFQLYVKQGFFRAPWIKGNSLAQK